MSKRADIAKVKAVLIDALDTCAADLGDDELFITIETAEPKQLTKAELVTEMVIEKALGREVKLLKTQEERYVLGVVLEPLKEMGKADTQDDTYSAVQVRDAAYRFMEDYGVVGLQHQVNVTGRVKILENWIQREDTVIDGEPVTAGTWLMGYRIVDDGLWERVKNGSLTGLSIGGVAQRVPLEITQN